MKDVLVIGVRNQQSISRVVLYTPDAPDGQTFREFEDRRSLALGVLYNPAFETYLLDRLPSDAAKVEANGVRHFRLSNGDRRAHWAMFAGNTRYVRTDEPFSDHIVEGNFFEASYDTSVSLMTRNLERMARPTHHADYDNVTPRIDGEAIARGISHLIGRPFMASWRAYDAVKAGDTAQAFVDLTDAYVASLDHLGLSAHPLDRRTHGGELTTYRQHRKDAPRPCHGVRKTLREPGRDSRRCHDEAWRLHPRWEALHTPGGQNIPGALRRSRRSLAP
jgi:hypothetical protein